MKPGSVPGPVVVKPDKKGDLVDYRRAKRLRDGLIVIGQSRAKCAACGADVTDGINV